MSFKHWAVVALACLLAAAPVITPELPSKFAGIAPAVIAVLAVLKHALDTKDGQEAGQ